VQEVCENPNVYCDETNALYVHVAAQSYLSDIKHCSESCQQSAADLYEKLKLALSDISVSTSISDMVDLSLRLTWD
jgi:hypothetical protein